MSGAPPVGPAASAATVIASRGVEKQRRAGKYTHPFGGMRQFAEDRARNSGWDRDCIQYIGTSERKAERAKRSDALSDKYKEEFVSINISEGKGRPKANNISAAKKTVRMIAERVLLQLEARATQVMFKEMVLVRKQTEKELNKLRHLHACGTENPTMTYDEIRALARDSLPAMESPSEGSAKHNGSAGSGSLSPRHTSADSPQEGASAMDASMHEDDVGEIEMMKQAIVEIRADEASKGFVPKMLSDRWADNFSAAARKLVAESFSEQSDPRSRARGCCHWIRNNRILMDCCGTFPVCRLCHIQDPSRVHDVKFEPVKIMVCMVCRTVQDKTQYCRNCDLCFGTYYCDLCGITDSTPNYNLYHCSKCRNCMPNIMFHCEECKVCVKEEGHAEFHSDNGVGPANNLLPDPPPHLHHTLDDDEPSCEGLGNDRSAHDHGDMTGESLSPHAEMSDSPLYAHMNEVKLDVGAIAASVDSLPQHPQAQNHLFTGM